MVEDYRFDLPAKRTSFFYLRAHTIAHTRLGPQTCQSELDDQADQIDQSFYYTKMEEKVSYLLHLLVKEKPESCIVFVNTRQMVDEIYEQLQSRQISVNKIHGGMLQEDRLRQMNAFKQGEFRILVSTDVAARGIDIQKVDFIINYEVPNTFWIYIHRIGTS